MPAREQLIEKLYKVYNNLEKTLRKGGENEPATKLRELVDIELALEDISKGADENNFLDLI